MLTSKEVIELDILCCRGAFCEYFRCVNCVAVFAGINFDPAPMPTQIVLWFILLVTMVSKYLTEYMLNFPIFFMFLVLRCFFDEKCLLFIFRSD